MSISIQNKRDISKIECLAIEGGGIEVISFLGVLDELQNFVTLKNIKKIIGTSAGTLLALYISLNIPIKTILREYLTLDFKSIQDCSYLFLLYNLFRHKGIDTGRNLRTFLISVLNKHIDNGKDITFLDLYKKTQIHLVFTTTNLNRKRTEYLSHTTTPDMKIVDGLCMSMCVPLYFMPIEYNNDLYVDGGFLNNYPIWYFDEDYKTIEEANTKVLGLKLMGRGDSLTNEITEERTSIISFKDYLYEMASLASLQIARGHIKDGFWYRTIPVFIDNVGILDFGISVPQKLKLIDQGRVSFNKFLTKHNIF